MSSLPVKYRPRKLEEIVSQQSVVKILQKQVKEKSFVHCYLFSGPSGVGKTTAARALANAINENKGTPIEIDGASNNGVDNVRNIIQEAKTRSLDSEYKVYIIDECHAITSAGWQSFLKCIEEPPEYTIFIFCTTDAQKVPATIINRVMKFNLTKIKTEDIRNRLDYICKQEKFVNYEESIDFISKLANGGMRDAISLLEKAAAYSVDLKIDNVLTALGSFSYKLLFELTNAIIDKQEDKIVSIIDNIYDNGTDLKLFMDTYFDFVLDLDKYAIFKDMSVLKIPASFEKDVKYSTSIENATTYYNWMSDKILDIRQLIRYDSTVKTSVEVMLLNISRGK